MLTNKRNKQTPLKTSNVLRYAMALGNKDLLTYLLTVCFMFCIMAFMSLILLHFVG